MGIRGWKNVAGDLKVVRRDSTKELKGPTLPNFIAVEILECPVLSAHDQAQKDVHVPDIQSLIPVHAIPGSSHHGVRHGHYPPELKESLKDRLILKQSGHVYAP